MNDSCQHEKSLKVLSIQIHADSRLVDLNFRNVYIKAMERQRLKQKALKL